MSKEGWKGQIPFYSEYILCKHVWKAKMFGALLGYLGAYVLTGVIVASLSEVLAMSIITTISRIVFLAALTIVVVLMYKVCKAFGHGVGYTIVGLFSEPIMFAVSGFEKSEYVGA